MFVPKLKTPKHLFSSIYLVALPSLLAISLLLFSTELSPFSGVLACSPLGVVAAGLGLPSRSRFWRGFSAGRGGVPSAWAGLAWGFFVGEAESSCNCMWNLYVFSVLSRKPTNGRWLVTGWECRLKKKKIFPDCSNLLIISKWKCITFTFYYGNKFLWQALKWTYKRKKMDGYSMKIPVKFLKSSPIAQICW